MQKISGTELYKKRTQWINENEDSHPAVLLCPGYDIKKSEYGTFFMEMQIRFPVISIPWGPVGKIAEKLTQNKIDRLLIYGSEWHMLQACRIRNILWEKAENERTEVGLWLFCREMESGRMLQKDSLWIRGTDGMTQYLGKMYDMEGDRLILSDARLSPQEKESQKVVRLVEGSLCKNNNIEERKRSLWEEMAQPLWLRYHIPETTCMVLALAYIGRKGSGRIKIRRNIWDRLAAQEVYARKNIWIPAGDVARLAEMAMAGIEMLPQQQQWLSWQQVYGFYHSLCR